MVRFSCEKTLLQQAVNAVSRAVAAKSSIPALEGILLETEHGLRLSGYNMQTGIRTEVEADIRESGRIVLNAKLFGDRDHSTIMHSLDKVEKQMRTDPAFAEKVKEITTNINSKK